jgi:hypothetical protein
MNQGAKKKVHPTRIKEEPQHAVAGVPADVGTAAV